MTHKYLSETPVAVAVRLLPKLKLLLKGFSVAIAKALIVSLAFCSVSVCPIVFCNLAEPSYLTYTRRAGEPVRGIE